MLWAVVNPFGIVEIVSKKEEKMKTFTKTTIAFAVILALTIALASCGGNSSPPASPTPPPEPAPTPAAPVTESTEPEIADIDLVPSAAKTVEIADVMDNMPTPYIVPCPAGYENKVWELSLNDQTMEMQPLGMNEKDAARAIEARTNGQIKITPYYNNTLLEQNNQWPGVVQGLADISIYTIDMNMGAQPQHSVLNQPANLPYPANSDMVRAVREFAKNHPEFAAEDAAQGIHTLAYSYNPVTSFHMAKGVIKSQNDLKGKKIIGNASIKPYAEGLGATSIAMGPGEFYTALEKGVADGLITHWVILRDSNMLDVFNSHTILEKSTSGVNATCLCFITNKDVWESIPPEYQEVVTEMFNWVFSANSQYNDAVREVVIKDAQSRGQEVVVLNAEESAPFFENARAAAQIWIDKATGEGVTNAQQLYEDWMAELSKY